jgi:hypothetical protein
MTASTILRVNAGLPGPDPLGDYVASAPIRSTQGTLAWRTDHWEPPLENDRLRRSLRPEPCDCLLEIVDGWQLKYM